MTIKNIQSDFFIRKLFSNIYEDRKLKLVIYNKAIQKIIEISLIHYKFMSGKYVVLESDGQGKEYNGYNDKLIFKGEYLNRKRHGKGEEFEVNGKLVYSGEYLNGKRHGTGKEYYSEIYLKEKEEDEDEEINKSCKNIVSFEGEYLKGKKWNGKGYDEKGNLLYELKDGNGFVSEYDRKDELLFEGSYINGEKHGKGIEYYPYYKTVSFDGEFYHGKRWNGKLYDENGNLVTEFNNGKGFMRDVYLEVLMGEAEFFNGELNGPFKEFNHDGVVETEGEYLNGKKHGFIKENKTKDYLFKGEYLYDHKFKGKEYIKGILEYEGEYLFDKKWNGKGYDKDGNIIYELINGNGQVKEYDEKANLIFEGEYLNGKRWNGKGKEYGWLDKLEYDGEYINGKKNEKESNLEVDEKEEEEEDEGSEN